MRIKGYNSFEKTRMKERFEHELDAELTNINTENQSNV